MIEEKLLFIYLWTNDRCNQAGCYEVDPDLVELQCKVSLNGNASKLSPKIDYFPEHGFVWIKNFFRRQCKNRSFAYAAIKSLRNCPPEIIDQWHKYNSKTLKSIGLNTQCNHGVITVLPQTSNKTRSGSSITKRGSSELPRGEQKLCQKCNTSFEAKYENHKLCNSCYKLSTLTAASGWIQCPHCNSGRSDVKKGKPCPECGKTV